MSMALVPVRGEDLVASAEMARLVPSWAGKGPCGQAAGAVAQLQGAAHVQCAAAAVVGSGADDGLFGWVRRAVGCR